MSKTLSILFLCFGTFGFSQEKDAYWNYMDSVLAETKLVCEIDNDSITTLMIFSYIYETGGGEAKGFLVENNIPGGTIDNGLPIPNCSDTCDVRMEATPTLDSLFILKYKWRASKEFIVDTCYLYRYHGSYIAYSKDIFSENAVRLTIHQWYLGPASTNERDVIQICAREARKTVFYPL